MDVNALLTDGHEELFKKHQAVSMRIQTLKCELEDAEREQKELGELAEKVNYLAGTLHKLEETLTMERAK